MVFLKWCYTLGIDKGKRGGILSLLLNELIEITVTLTTWLRQQNGGRDIKYYLFFLHQKKNFFFVHVHLIQTDHHTKTLNSGVVKGWAWPLCVSRDFFFLFFSLYTRGKFKTFSPIRFVGNSWVFAIFHIGIL